MGWSIGYDDQLQRDVGYGVPATCDHPGCGAAIDRGISHVCGGEPFGGENGCGLHFCGDHLSLRYVDPGEDPEEPCLGPLCAACAEGKPHFPLTPDTPVWLQHKLTDPSWLDWRDTHPKEVLAMQQRLDNLKE